MSDTVDRSPASPALRPFSFNRQLSDGWPSRKFMYVFRVLKKMLGRIEMRTRNRIYCQTIRTVRDISRDDRARIATCSLRTPTDRLKENYSIDSYSMSGLLFIKVIWQIHTAFFHFDIYAYIVSFCTPSYHYNIFTKCNKIAIKQHLRQQTRNTLAYRERI